MCFYCSSWARWKGRKDWLCNNQEKLELVVPECLKRIARGDLQTLVVCVLGGWYGPWMHQEERGTGDIWPSGVVVNTSKQFFQATVFALGSYILSNVHAAPTAPSVIGSRMWASNHAFSSPRQCGKPWDSHLPRCTQPRPWKGEERTAVSIVVGLRFSLSTAYTLGDMGRRSEGDCGSMASLRLKETTGEYHKGYNIIAHSHLLCPGLTERFISL